MLLCSLSYGNYMGVAELPVGVLKLFSSLVECPTKKIEFASEIIQAALSGKIRLDASFSIDAYEMTIRKNKFLVKENERKKKLYLDDGSFDDDASEVMCNGCVKTEYLSKNALSIDGVDDAYDKILDEDELRYAVETLKSLNDKFIIDYSIDLILAISKALSGYPKAIKALKNLCLECKFIAYLVEVILSSSKEFNTLFN